MFTLGEAVGPITGLDTYETFIYYTDWGLHGVFRLNIRSLHKVIVAKDLIRPTSIVLLHQDSLEGEDIFIELNIYIYIYIYIYI